MHPHRSALFDMHEATQSLGDLSEPQQIMTLKLELFHALERANDSERRTAFLETRVTEFEAQVGAHGDDDGSALGHLFQELVRTTRELTTARAEHAKALRKARLERLNLESQRDALDELCRSLLLTIERAVDSDADGDDERNLRDQARVSAS